jgi:3-phosphoshikimate 1-carboxyvinyltransferase
MRALVFATLAQGKSVVRNYLDGADTEKMVAACRLCGAIIHKTPEILEIEGNFGAAQDVIDAGNSGIILRFLGAIASLLPTYTVITGDESIRHRRVVKPLLEGLNQLGAFAVSMRGDDFAPIILRGPLKGGVATISGEDSQPVSGLLIASAFAQSPTELNVKNPGEKPWVNLTLKWFDRLGIAYKNHNFETYSLPGNAKIKGFDYTVPADWSSALYPIVAAVITDSEITLEGVDFSDPQGDKEVVSLMQALGARFKIDGKNLTVYPSPPVEGATIDVGPFIDAITLLPVLACFATTKTTFVGAEIARHKECDRIRAICNELKKMGAEIEERPDGLVSTPSRLHGATTDSYGDHRMAMALTVAALAAKGETVICGTDVVAKSFPNFFQLMRTLGANIE